MSILNPSTWTFMDKQRLSTHRKKTIKNKNKRTNISLHAHLQNRNITLDQIFVLFLQAIFVPSLHFEDILFFGSGFKVLQTQHLRMSDWRYKFDVNLLSYFQIPNCSQMKLKVCMSVSFAFQIWTSCFYAVNLYWQKEESINIFFDKHLTCSLLGIR